MIGFDQQCIHAFQAFHCVIIINAQICTNSHLLAAISKTVGSRLNFIDSATVAVQSYAPTLYEAAALNDIVKRAMFDIIALPSVSACRLNSDYNFTDTSTKKYRYQAVFDLTY